MCPDIGSPVNRDYLRSKKSLANISASQFAFRVNPVLSSPLSAALCLSVSLPNTTTLSQLSIQFESEVNIQTK